MMRVLVVVTLVVNLGSCSLVPNYDQHSSGVGQPSQHGFDHKFVHGYNDIEIGPTGEVINGGRSNNYGPGPDHRQVNEAGGGLVHHSDGGNRHKYISPKLVHELDNSLEHSINSIIGYRQQEPRAQQQNHHSEQGGYPKSQYQHPEPVNYHQLDRNSGAGRTLYIETPSAQKAHAAKSEQFGSRLQQPISSPEPVEHHHSSIGHYHHQPHEAPTISVGPNGEIDNNRQVSSAVSLNGPQVSHGNNRVAPTITITNGPFSHHEPRAHPEPVGHHGPISHHDQAAQLSPIEHPEPIGHHGPISHHKPTVQLSPIGHPEPTGHYDLDSHKHSAYFGPVSHPEPVSHHGPITHPEPIGHHGQISHHEHAVHLSPIGHPEPIGHHGSIPHGEPTVHLSPIGHPEPVSHHGPIPHHEPAVHLSPIGHPEPISHHNSILHHPTTLGPIGHPEPVSNYGALSHHQPTLAPVVHPEPVAHPLVPNYNKVFYSNGLSPHPEPEPHHQANFEQHLQQVNHLVTGPEPHHYSKFAHHPHLEPHQDIAHPEPAPGYPDHSFQLGYQHPSLHHPVQLNEDIHYKYHQGRLPGDGFGPGGHFSPMPRAEVHLVPVPEPVPVAEPVPVDKPYPVPVDKPYAVPVDRPYPKHFLSKVIQPHIHKTAIIKTEVHHREYDPAKFQELQAQQSQQQQQQSQSHQAGPVASSGSAPIPASVAPGTSAENSQSKLNLDPFDEYEVFHSKK